MRINLKDLYPFYKNDVFVEVSDEIYLQFREWERLENRRRRMMMRHNAYYTLNINDCEIMFVSHTPEEIYEKKLSREELYAAIGKLPEAQSHRIYAHYFLGMSISEMSRVEGVSKQTISESIQLGMKTLKRKIQRNS